MQLPPLFRAEAHGDPLATAVSAGQAGADPGLVTHAIGSERLCAAILFAPEVPPDEACVVLPLCAVGFQNALGALAPPELAVHLGWDGAIRLNGAEAGRLRLHGDDDWLVVSLTLDLLPRGEGGDDPDRTALYAEGCGEVAPDDLIGAWVRHTLTWLDTWAHEGLGPLVREWSGLWDERGRTVTAAGLRGEALGVADGLALVLKTADGPRTLPLTALLETVP